MKRRRTILLIPTLAVLVTAGILLAPALFGGRVPAQTDWIYSYAPWYGLDEPDIHNQNGGDSFLVYLPDRFFALYEWRAGRLPLWNPYPSGGIPIMGAQTAQPLDPLILLAYVFPPGMALGVNYALLLAVAGWGTILFLRRRGIREPVALAVGGVALAANPYFISWLELRVFVAGLATLPLALWALETVLFGARRRRGAAVLGLSLGYAALAGTLQTLVLFFGLLILRWLWIIVEGRFSFVRGAGSPAAVPGEAPRVAGEAPATSGSAPASAAESPGGGRTHLYVLLGLVAGLAVAAIPLAASFELLGQSTRLGEGSRYYEANNFLPWRALALWFNPELFGGIQEKYFPAREFFGRTMISGSGWGAMGIVPLGLALFGLAGRGMPRTEKIFWGGLAGSVLVLLLALRGPLYGALAALWPGLHNVDLLRGLFVVNLAGAVAAAWGAVALLEAWRSGSRRWIFWWAGLVAAGVVLIALARRGVGPPAGGFDDFVPILVVGGAVIVLGLAGGLLRLRPSLRLWILLAVTLVELGRFHYIFNTFAPSDTLYTEGPPMQILRAEIGAPHFYRFMSVGGTRAYPPNTSSLYGLSDMRSYTNMPIARFRLLLECAEGRRNLGNQPHVDNPMSPIYRLLGGKVIAAVPRVEPGTFTREISAGTYARESCLPRAFLAHRAETVPDEAAMRAALDRPDFDPGVVYLEAGRGPLPAVAPARGAETVAIRLMEPQRVVVDVAATAPGILVLTDAFYPGWRATVDGRDTPIFPADWGLRGVAVPAGATRVEFRYRPGWLWPAGLLGGVGLGVLVVFLAWSAVFERPRRRAASAKQKKPPRPPRKRRKR